MPTDDLLTTCPRCGLEGEARDDRILICRYCGKAWTRESQRPAGHTQSFDAKKRDQAAALMRGFFGVQGKNRHDVVHGTQRQRAPRKGRANRPVSPPPHPRRFRGTGDIGGGPEVE